MVPTNQTTSPLPNLVNAELRKRVKKAGTRKAAASELDISASLVTEVLKGRRPASPSLVEKLGFVRICIEVPQDMVPRVESAIASAITEQETSQKGKK